MQYLNAGYKFFSSLIFLSRNVMLLNPLCDINIKAKRNDMRVSFIVRPRPRMKRIVTLIRARGPSTN